MGLVVSVVSPTVSNTISSRILLGPEKPSVPQNNSKYDNLSAPISTELGPSPGNKPSPNPIVGAPIIHPPKDTISKAPDNSAYDTLDMTPEVDWNKRMMMKGTNEVKNK